MVLESDAASGPPRAVPPRGSARHIRLTSHSGAADALPIHWGAATAAERGPVIGTTTGVVPKSRSDSKPRATS